eukprot:3617710-Heterocapsa_arctica.AAC.1
MLRYALQRRGLALPGAPPSVTFAADRGGRPPSAACAAAATSDEMHRRAAAGVQPRGMKFAQLVSEHKTILHV